MSAEPTRLVRITLDSEAPAATPEQDQERRVALFELAEEHKFDVKGAPGDMTLRLTPSPGAIVFTVEAPDAAAPAARFELRTEPFEATIRDYHAICAAYFDAVRRLPVNRIEALDEGRRAIHGAAGDQLVEALEPFAKLDTPTGKRLFSLISTLL